MRLEVIRFRPAEFLSTAATDCGHRFLCFSDRDEPCLFFMRRFTSEVKSGRPPRATAELEIDERERVVCKEGKQKETLRKPQEGRASYPPSFRVVVKLHALGPQFFKIIYFALDD